MKHYSTQSILPEAKIEIDQFWNRWCFEHLTELSEHHKVRSRLYSKVAIQLGDDLLVEKGKTPSMALGKGYAINSRKGRM